jgi:hypothetical protein
MKRKLKYSLYNLFEETPVEVVRMQAKIKAIMAGGVVVTWMETNDRVGIILSLSSGIIDFLIGGFGYEEN